ncbi:MAG: cytochrome b [Alphaproteobacteria bacterium GM202ARS2]|nr:cytochrome b [Alphaproteobacteria bacterium GM202ARS2]
MLHNSSERYGTVAMALHWVVAALFLALYVSVYYRQWFTEPKTEANWSALQLHLSFGVTMAVFVVLRVLYKLWSQPPQEVPGTPLEHRAAKSVHWTLYAVMIIMPITGYLGTGADTEFFGLFDITQFRHTGMYETVVQGWLGLTWEQFEPPIDFVHKQGGAYFVWVLIGVHVSAALFHHFVRKDNTLRRMLPVSLK